MPSLRRVKQLCEGALAIAIAGSGFSCGDCVQTPSVSAISPPNVTAGSAGIVLVVTGDHFQHDSTINWNGMPRTTTFVSSQQLTATITTADLAQPATVQVTVISPPQSQPVSFGSGGTSSGPSTSVQMDCGGGTSNAASFAINP